MSAFATWFGWQSSTGNTDELFNIYPLSVTEAEFTRIDVRSIYTKILTDVMERTDGLSEEHQALFWDNCLASESSQGLISFLAEAMSDKAELFLVLREGVLRKATGEEQNQIIADYKATAQSKVGTYISFKKYTRTDMIKLYSSLEYSTIYGLHKSMKVSTAVQLKIKELRATTAVIDSSLAKAQAQLMARGLRDGKDLLMDSEDSVVTTSPDLTPTQSALVMLNQKRSFYLGMPASYVTGEAAKGMGDSGIGDAKAVERGLKNYYVSIIKPVCKSIFDSNTTFKSEDFDQLVGALETIKTFELVSDEYMAPENKLKVVNKLFGFPEDTKGGPKPAFEPPPVVPGQVPPGQPPEGSL